MNLRICILLSLISFFFHGIANGAIPPCYQELEKNFFRPELVSQALSFHLYISQSSWSAINAEIKKRSKDIPRMVRERAAKMHPNPFEIPYQPEAAGAVFESVLRDVLAASLATYNVTNQVVVAQIFEYLQQKQITLWNACFVSEEISENPRRGPADK